MIDLLKDDTEALTISENTDQVGVIYITGNRDLWKINLPSKNLPVDGEKKLAMESVIFSSGAISLKIKLGRETDGTDEKIPVVSTGIVK